MMSEQAALGSREQALGPGDLARQGAEQHGDDRDRIADRRVRVGRR